MQETWILDPQLSLFLYDLHPMICWVWGWNWTSTDYRIDQNDSLNHNLTPLLHFASLVIHQRRGAVASRNTCRNVVLGGHLDCPKGSGHGDKQQHFVAFAPSKQVHLTPLEHAANPVHGCHLRIHSTSECQHDKLCEFISKIRSCNVLRRESCMRSTCAWMFLAVQTAWRCSLTKIK